MSLGESVARLEHVTRSLLHRKGRAPGAQLGVEVASLEELHHDERTPVLESPRVECPGHVRALQPHRRARFPREALDEPRAFGGRGKEELERDLLVEIEVGRRDDDAHPTHPEDPLDPVLRCEKLADLYRWSVGKIEHE